MASPSRRVPCAYTSSLQHHHMFSTSPHVLNIITSSQHHLVFDPSMFLRPSTFSTSIHLDLQQPSSISTFNLLSFFDLQLHPPSTFNSNFNQLHLQSTSPSTSINFTFNLLRPSTSTFFDLSHTHNLGTLAGCHTVQKDEDLLLGA